MKWIKLKDPWASSWRYDNMPLAFKVFGLSPVLSRNCGTTYSQSSPPDVCTLVSHSTPAILGNTNLTSLRVVGAGGALDALWDCVVEVDAVGTCEGRGTSDRTPAIPSPRKFPINSMSQHRQETILDDVGCKHPGHRRNGTPGYSFCSAD